MKWSSNIIEEKTKYIRDLIKWKFNIKNQDEYKDLAQEVLLKVISSYKETKGVKLNTFIYRVTKNYVIDKTRRRKLEFDDVCQNTLEAKHTTDSVEDLYIIKEEQEFTRYLISKLPEKYRNVIEDRYLLEMRYDEIAEKRKIALGSVKGQIHRAKKILRENLETT